MVLIDHITAFKKLIFPVLCAGCERKLKAHETEICLHCLTDLPKCRFRDAQGNMMARQFWGRVDCPLMLSYCFYSKGTSFANMLQSLKYENRPETGFELGKMFGNEQYSMILGVKPDYLIPVPIHRSKTKTRGYNQSEQIANGLSIALKIPVLRNRLIRVSKGMSQTRKGRWKRSQEIEGAFLFRAENDSTDTHYLLVDDVFTTGATAESCAKAILKEKGAKVSVVTLGFAWS